MGRGYWILIADGFGDGLNLINPRLHEDSSGNWWPLKQTPGENEISEAEILERHCLWDKPEFMKVIFS